MKVVNRSKKCSDRKFTRSLTKGAHFILRYMLLLLPVHPCHSWENLGVLTICCWSFQHIAMHFLAYSVIISQEWYIHFLEQLKVHKTRKNTERILEGCRQSRQVWFVTSLKNMTQECGKWWMEFVVVAKLGGSWKDVNCCVVMGRKEPRHKNWNRWSRSWRRWKSAHSNHQCTPSAPEKQSTLKSKV